MDNPNAVAYFRQLADLASSMEVTDAQGAGISLDDGVGRTLHMLLAARSAGSKVLLIANGGSAAIVSHMQNDLCKAVGVRAMVFNEAPLLTALTNDEGYIHAFERCVDLWAEPKDIVLAISSSGRSENLLLGVKAAKAHGALVISMSGFAPDNPLRKMGDLNFYVPSNTYGPVELSHQALTHFLTDCAMTMHD
jgi:D-sedoheptulose 7-phosphate isomerase